MFKPSDSIRRQPASCAELLRTLGDATRLEVVRVLMQGPRRVFEINEELDIEPSLLSHHMRALRQVGLVDAQREGKARLYSLAPGVVARRSRSGDRLDLGCCKLVFGG